MILSTLMCLLATAAAEPSAIHVNQVGYATQGPKLAVVLVAADSASLLDEAGAVVWRGPLGAPRFWDVAGDTARLFDFSAFRTPGVWRISAGGEASFPVRITERPWEEVLKGMIKGLWYNRASYAIQGSEAGVWTRAAGHPDTAVRIHSSAVGPVRTRASRIRSPGGWYDAGDYGKYLPSAAISTWSLLHLYRSASDFFDTLAVGVPAHAEVASDLLDEALWSLRWMLTMQDPDDGGVYHKLTTLNFPGDAVLPVADRSDRYVVQKSTAATLELAATAAKAARILKGRLPGLSDSCLAAARSAWAWARLHPHVLHIDDSLKENYFPVVNSGPYDDTDVSDEFDWAAAELLLATGEDTFATAVGLPQRVVVGGYANWLGWADTRSLGLLSLSLEGAERPQAATLSRAADSMLVATARDLRSGRITNPYHLPKAGFWWSANTAYANNGFLCWNAWRVTGDTAFRSAAVDMLDYLLGRNATGYSFVTGFGSCTPLHPHHRISNGDGVTAPVPGLVVAGPNPGREDDCDGYPSLLPAKSYLDDACSYATNEPAVNQSAALILLAGELSQEAAVPASGIASAASPVAGALLFSLRGTQLSVRGPSPERLEAFSVDGRLVTVGMRTGTLALPGRGLFLVRALEPGSGRVRLARVAVP